MAELKYLTPDLVKRLQKLCIDHKEKDAQKQLDENCHDRYKESVDHCCEMAVHVFGAKPESLLKRVRPREDESIRQYRLDSFEPVTKSTCKKALNVVHKIFNSDGYSIRFESDKKAQALKTYSLEEYPRFNSVVNYMANFVMKKMVADANGIILVSPFEIPKSTTERVRPYLSCYSSKDIHSIDEFHALLFDKYERGDKYQRWFYTFVDAIGIYYLMIEKTTSGEAAIIEYAKYIHGRNVLPFWHLGGDYSDKVDGLLESYFSGALPFWNEVVMDHSDLRGSIRMHMFPQKWELADECEYVEDGKYACDGGYIFNQDKGEKHKCPSCNGAGRKSVKSPFETYWVSKDKFTDGAAGFQVPFGYVEPATEATKILKDERDLGLQKGLAALNMDVLNNIGSNQSGISKDIDKRTELKEFLQKIADQFFEVHLPNAFDWFAYYMFGVETANNKETLDGIQPQIAKPTEFDVYSVVELTEQFKGAKQAQLNPSYLAVEQAEIQNKKFQRNPDLLKSLNLELELDRLAEVSRDDISAMMMNLTITKETAIIHDNIRAFVRRALEEDKSFVNKKYLEKIKVMEKYAQEIIEANKIHIDIDGLETQLGENGQPIDTPVDIEAEAKANLKGSVGGVQGLIQIQTSVAEGITDYEAAVVMLFEIYGFDDATARKLLGDKAKLESAHQEKKANEAAAALAKQKPPIPPK